MIERTIIDRNPSIMRMKKTASSHPKIAYQKLWAKKPKSIMPAEIKTYFVSLSIFPHLP
jgi:hypothetical protein